MPLSNFPNGFANGLTVRGMPIQIAYPGKVFFVNNSSVIPQNGIAGSDSNPGTYIKPRKTIASALTLCTAGRGDIIMCMPGHAETVSSATGLLMNVAGVLIIGLGTGALRPTITLNTANTATIAVSASQMGFNNFLFVANFLNIASLFTLSTAKDFSLVDCEFRDTSSVLNFVAIVTSSSTSNANDGLYIQRSNFFGLGNASNTTLLATTGTHDRWTVQGCYIANTATTAGSIAQITSGKNLTNLLVDSCTVNVTGAVTASMAYLILAPSTTSTGVISNCKARTLCDTTPVPVTAGSGLRFYLNYYSSNADKSGFLLPVLDT